MPQADYSYTHTSVACHFGTRLNFPNPFLLNAKDGSPRKKLACPWNIQLVPKIIWVHCAYIH